MRIFLSTPISSFRSAKQLQIYKSEVVELISKLKETGVVYSEIDKLNNEDDYDLPEESIASDFRAIRDSDIFILHYPSRTPTSALIELGYALAYVKKIVLISPSINVLPYLAQGIHAFNSNSVIIQSKCLGDSIDEIITTVQRISAN